MSELTVSEFVTLDGVMEAPGGEPSHPHTGWAAEMGDAFPIKRQEVFDHDALLVGRVTYESFAGAWPGYEGDMADRMNSMPKYVVSNTLTDAEWNNTTVLAGDAVQAVTDLLATDVGSVLVVGSGTLVHALLEADLVDRLQLLIYPVTIGGGFRVFPDSTRKTSFTLTDTQTFPNSLTWQVFRRTS